MLPTESLFYRAVLQVIIEEIYGVTKSDRHVGKTFSKSSSFIDYVRRSLKKLELDDSKVPYVASSNVLFSVQDCGQQIRHIMTFKSLGMWWSGCPVQNMLCEEQSWSQLQDMLCCTGQQGLKRLCQAPELPV
ncbi:methyltransferase-like protein 25 [Turdus rufiventris]|nr:methyltransferase-like protein 25 [Turdus rufiventris]